MSGQLRELFSALREEIDAAEHFHEAGLAYESGLALGRANELILSIALEVQK